jgi:hypothetical protein
MRVGIACVGLAMACMSGTETDIIVSTDAPCTSISAAIVSLSGAQTYLPTCAGGDFGTAVYHPADSTQTDVVVVATVDKSDPAACLASPGAGCIVARRHAPVAYQTNVPVVLEQACAGIACPANETCMKAVCTTF